LDPPVLSGEPTYSSKDTKIENSFTNFEKLKSGVFEDKQQK